MEAGTLHDILAAVSFTNCFQADLTICHCGKKKKKKLVQLNDTNAVSCHRRVALLLLRLTSQVMLEVKIFFYSKFPTNFAPNNAAQPSNTPPNFAGCTNTLMR